uniref:Uncharacterized protein n=1 Tax=Rhizophora mucronata TaxID=61149 RepID=A0A2P2P1A3_RHIMU
MRDSFNFNKFLYPSILSCFVSFQCVLDLCL